MLDDTTLTPVFNAYVKIFTTCLFLSGGIWVFYLGYLRWMKGCHFSLTPTDYDNSTERSAAGLQTHIYTENHSDKQIRDHVGKSDELGGHNPRSVQYIRKISNESVSIPQQTKVIVLAQYLSDWIARFHFRLPELSEYPSGFRPRTLQERKQLGLYPDYAELSGVPWPQPYLDFDSEKALPRPYRPFRWPYHQTMASWKLEPDWWLEVENTYKERIAGRKELYRIHGKLVLDFLQGEDVDIACRELMELGVMWLEKRYPKCFQLVDDSEIPSGKIFVNKILKTRTFLDRGIHPLTVLLENVPEDFVLMLPTASDSKNSNEHSKIQYTFRAGIICSSIGWNLGTKLGLSLHDIHHTTGPVPHYAKKLSFSMDRFFNRSLPPNKPIQRGSWSFELGKPLFVLPDDPHHTRVRSTQDQNLKLEDVNLRVDWQTLRRLPLSGAVCFNYKAVFTELEELKEEKGVPALLAKVLTEGDEEILKYKGTWHVEHFVVPLMEMWAKEQINNGVVEHGWEVGTLEQSPFFQGWQDVWQRRQGF